MIKHGRALPDDRSSSVFLWLPHIAKDSLCCLQEFEDLDEITARYIQPMASFARDLLGHKYFQECHGGSKEVETVVQPFNSFFHLFCQGSPLSHPLLSCFLFIRKWRSYWSGQRGRSQRLFRTLFLHVKICLESSYLATSLEENHGEHKTSGWFGNTMLISH